MTLGPSVSSAAYEPEANAREGIDRRTRRSAGRFIGPSAASRGITISVGFCDAFVVGPPPVDPAPLMQGSRPVPGVDKITLDRDTFKALASDTRLDILKALDERQKTVTELAKQLDLDKSTVFEHLEKLAAVGLIQKLEDERSEGDGPSEDAPQRARKWVYWQLSWKGRRLLHPEAITLALVLSSAGASLVTAVMAAWLWFRSKARPAGRQ